MRRGSASRLLALAWLCAGLGGCGNSAAEFMRPPLLSPVGSGMAPPGSETGEEAEVLPIHLQSGSGRGLGNLYTDQRIAKVGDIVTVVISINDKASFGNSTDRSTTAKTNLGFSWMFTPASSSSSSSQGSPGTLSNDINSTSSSQGQGTIDRSEQIQFSVPAVVTQVLPNGNLLIRGSQEVRVNFELRQLSVAGIVRPSDISRNNTIAYDHVAEARISYGGRGRISEVQQPAWGQQIYDYVKPF
jgi:flagellar L-ring protein precursor FlgH